MSTHNPAGRRSLDGPIRRPALPLHSDSSRVPEPAGSQVSQPIQPSFAEPDLPVFEYRKPRRARLNQGWWRYARFAAIGLAVAVVGLGIWFAYKGLTAAGNIISKSNGGAPALAGALDPTKLKGEGDGRVNVLVLGIGGQGHEAPNLSDSIMVMSIDPKTKDTAMLSIPRDLYVQIPAAGNYNKQYGKINAANVYGGPDLASKVVSKVLGVPIHYYVLVDFSGFKKAIDAVGGIDINVPEAIADPSYPCDNGKRICPFSIKAGKQHMDGTLALKYARCRKGTCGNDFGRAARQQIIITALRQKALEASTLTNPVKLTGLIDAIGGHVKTDMQPNEITKMASIVKDIDTSKIVNKVLDTDSPDSLLMGGTNIIPGAGYIETPKLGIFNYSDIQDFVKNIFIDHYITDENARLEVQNGSGMAGVAGGVVKSLKSAHYNVSEPLNAPELYAKTVIYDYTGGKKPYTMNYLERRFGVKASRAASPTPATDANGMVIPAPEIRIILGSDYKAPITSQ